MIEFLQHDSNKVLSSIPDLKFPHVILPTCYGSYVQPKGWDFYCAISDNLYEMLIICWNPLIEENKSISKTVEWLLHSLKIANSEPDNH